MGSAASSFTLSPVRAPRRIVCIKCQVLGMRLPNVTAPLRYCQAFIDTEPISYVRHLSTHSLGRQLGS